MGGGISTYPRKVKENPRLEEKLAIKEVRLRIFVRGNEKRWSLLAKAIEPAAFKRSAFELQIYEPNPNR